MILPVGQGSQLILEFEKVPADQESQLVPELANVPIPHGVHASTGPVLIWPINIGKIFITRWSWDSVGTCCISICACYSWCSRVYSPSTYFTYFIYFEFLPVGHGSQLVPELANVPAPHDVQEFTPPPLILPILFILNFYL